MVSSPLPPRRTLEDLLLKRTSIPLRVTSSGEVYPLTPVMKTSVLHGFRNERLAKRLFRAYLTKGSTWEERAAWLARHVPSSLALESGIYPTQTLPTGMILPTYDYRRTQGVLLIPRGAYESLRVLLAEEDCFLDYSEQ